MATTNHKITEQGNRQRELILRAAEKEFESHGFGGARMQRIADIAGVPKANLHYYFANKAGLYDAVLANVIELWDQALMPVGSDDDPALVLEQYVRMKVEFTRLYPSATRIFALEMLSGWHNISTHLQEETRNWTIERAEELSAWIKDGKILPVDPFHLIFMIWATTQHYAESDTQVRSIYQKDELSKADHDRLADSLVEMVLRICGLQQKR